MSTRVLIIIVLSFFSDEIAMKGTIIYFILFILRYLSYYYKPYYDYRMNT